MNSLCHGVQKYDIGPYHSVMSFFAALYFLWTFVICFRRDKKQLNGSFIKFTTYKYMKIWHLSFVLIFISE